MLSVQPGPRDRRLLSALLILAVVAVTFYIVSQLTDLFFYFGDIFLIFFLAWLLAFIISPLVARIVGIIPRLPRAVATILVYGAARRRSSSSLVVVAASALATSITDFVDQLPNLASDLPEILAPWQARLDSIGLGQIDLAAQADAALGNLNELREPAGRAAAAARSRQPRRPRQAAHRLVPVALHGPRPRPDPLVPVPARAAELRRRGGTPRASRRALVRWLPARPGRHGLVYGLIAVVTSLLLGLRLPPVTSVAAGLLR